MSIDRPFKCKFYVLMTMFRNARFRETVEEECASSGMFRDVKLLEPLWQILKDHTAQYGESPARETVEFLLELNEAYSTPAERRSFGVLLDRIWSSGSADVKVASQIVKEYLERESIGRLRRAVSVGAEDRIEEAVEEFSRVRSRVGVIIPQEKNPIRDGVEGYLQMMQRDPIGIPFIDKAMEGGLMAGDLLGFIMPTGVGKTTLVWQAANECVMRKRHVILFSFEQILQGDQALRAAVLACGGTRQDWSARSLEKLDPRLRERFERVRPLWSEYLHAYDTWAEPQTPLRSVGDLFDVVKMHMDRHQEPFLITLDWLGLMMDKILQNRSFRSHREELSFGESQMQELKSYAQQTGVRVLVFHQKDAASSGKSAEFVGSSQNSKGDKSYSMLMDNCFVSSKKSTEDNVIFKLDKARNVAQSTVKVHLDGRRCMFTDVIEDFEITVNTPAAASGDEDDEDEGIDIYED
jgi:hypothetical protein